MYEYLYIYYFQVNTQSNGNTALQVACMNGHTDVVLFLIGKDADLENEVKLYNMYF